MSTPTADIADQLRTIDLCLVRALRDVRLARIAMDHSPSGANVVRAEEAERTLNDLLDQRLTVRPARQQS